VSADALKQSNSYTNWRQFFARIEAIIQLKKVSNLPPTLPKSHGGFAAKPGEVVQS
jgi:hypothetical protein